MTYKERMQLAVDLAEAGMRLRESPLFVAFADEAIAWSLWTAAEVFYDLAMACQPKAAT